MVTPHRKRRFLGLMALLSAILATTALSSCSSSSSGSGSSDSGSSINSVLPSSISVKLPASLTVQATSSDSSDTTTAAMIRRNSVARVKSAAKDDTATLSSNYEILQSAMSVVQMPVQMVGMLMVIADGVIGQNNLSTSSTAKDETLKVTSALISRIEEICSGSGYTMDLSSYFTESSYTAKSFVYNKTTSSGDYAYYVNLSITISGATLDSTIYWSADKTKLKVLLGETNDGESGVTTMSVVNDSSAGETLFAYRSTGNTDSSYNMYLSAKAIADSSSSSNGLYIAIYNMDTSATTYLESAYGDDKGGAATIPATVTDSDGTTSEQQLTFYFSATGADIDESASSCSTQYAKLDTALSSVDTLALLSSLSCTITLAGTDTATITGDTSVTQGTAYTVSVSGSGTYTSYAWALDGATISGATSSSTTIATSGLTVGMHGLTVIVTDSSDEAYSARLSFAVTK
jgi:hypothetical protein